MAGQRESRLSSFSKQFTEGMRRNEAFLRGKLWSWIDDQRYKAKRKRERPDLKRVLRLYPYRYPLPSRIANLYQQTVKDVKHGLGRWANPWLIAPSCAFIFAYDAHTPGSYNPYRHEILLSRTYLYWNRQTTMVRRALRAVFRPARWNKRHVNWTALGARVLQRAHHYQERFEELEDADHLPGLKEAWAQFLQELPPILEECAAIGRASHDLHLWYAELTDLHQALQQEIRAILVHELVHAHTQWIEFHEQGEWYRWLALEEHHKREKHRKQDQSEQDQERRPFVAGKAMNEALTEWLAQRLCTQFYGEYTSFEWRGVGTLHGYTPWIIECLVHALDYHWERITQAVPALATWSVTSATDLLYAVCFADSQLIPFFKEALSVMSNDPDAFDKLSRACERFTTNPLPENALLEEAFQDFKRLLSPYTDNLQIIFKQPSEEDEKSNHNEESRKSAHAEPNRIETIHLDS